MTRILVVEDNESNRDMLVRRLERRGFDVAVSVDGPQALEMAIEVRPDLVVIDMGLPQIDGYEVTRRLKRDAATQDIPILGLSAHAMPGDRDKALAAGCDDYDTKPVEFERLIAKIQAALGKLRDS